MRQHTHSLSRSVCTGLHETRSIVSFSFSAFLFFRWGVFQVLAGLFVHGSVDLCLGGWIRPTRPPSDESPVKLIPIAGCPPNHIPKYEPTEMEDGERLGGWLYSWG